MRSRPLGNVPLLVSEVGLGTAQLANVDGQHSGSKYISLEDARKVLSAAIDAGVSFFDTSDQYGAAESLLGELPRSVKDQVVIATKAGLRSDGSRDFSQAYIRGQVDRSLKRLAVERIDLFQLTKPTRQQLQEEGLLGLLADLKRVGKIEYAGVVVGDEDAGDACIASGSVDCLQVLYNLLYTRAEGLVERASQRGLGVVIRSPLSSGLLSGNYTHETTFPDHDERSAYFSGRAFLERIEILQNLQRELRVPDASLLEYSLRFILSNPHVSVVIPGASTVGQLNRYVAAGRMTRFGDSELGEIRNTIAGQAKKLHQAFQT